MNPVREVTLVGAGNLATHLAQAFVQADISIRQVFSNDIYKARKLAWEVDAEPIDQLEQVQKNVDLLFLAVKDDVIGGVAGFLGKGPATIVHGAGSVPMEVLHLAGPNIGVFYPLQTFSKERPVDFSHITICLEAASVQVREQLVDLAQRLRVKVVEMDSEQRRKVHLAAVFVNNFTNYLLKVAGGMAAEQHVSLDIFRPLAEETVAKAFELGPEAAQTGPAERQEDLVLQRHLKLLEDHPEWQRLYHYFSEAISGKKLKEE